MLNQQSVSWQPRSYQKAGVELMLKQACAGLLFSPGLGKTSVVYAAFKILRDVGYVKRVLILCPLRPALNVWPRQKDRWTEFKDLRVTVLHGKSKESLLADPSADIYVINPEGLPWLFGAEVKNGKLELDADRIRHLKTMFDVLVVDESTKFKNPSTARFKLLRKIIPHFRRRYILTGTPAPRGLLDLFGQIYILDEGASLGQYITHYRNKFFYPSGYGGYDWVPQHDAAERIGAAIHPLVLRVGADGNIDLPELVLDDIYVDLPVDAMREYVRMENELVALLQGDTLVAANAAVASAKCRQIANGAIYNSQGSWTLVHDSKIEALADLLDQLQGEAALITYEFDHDNARIASALKVACISTGNARKDDATIEAFRRGELGVVMGQPQSVALGIDGLQDACHHIIMFGVTWRLQDYLQVIDRVRRSGQASARVIVHRILARGTVDEKVLKVLDDRAATQESFMQVLQSLRAAP